MESCSSLLVTEETTSRSSFPSSYRTYMDRLDPAQAESSRVLYRKVDSLENTGFLGRLSECRTKAWFVRHSDSGEVRVHSAKCHLRWCYHCSEARQNFITHQVSPWFTRVQNPKLLTLTLRHTSSPLKEQLEFIYKCWQKFRKRKFVSDRLRGGVWFFQIKLSKADGYWHPHFHVLVDSDYLIHDKLIELWSLITVGSTHVHIKSISDPDKTVAHTARYAARPAQLLDLPDDKDVELFYAFKGRRLCGTFGSANQISLKQEKPEDANKWVSVGRWSSIAGMYLWDERAKEILHCWNCNLPLDEKYSMLEFDREMDGYPIRDPPEKTEPEKFLFGMYG